LQTDFLARHRLSKTQFYKVPASREKKILGMVRTRINPTCSLSDSVLPRSTEYPFAKNKCQGSIVQGGSMGTTTHCPAAALAASLVQIGKCSITSHGINETCDHLAGTRFQYKTDNRGFGD